MTREDIDALLERIEERIVFMDERNTRILEYIETIQTYQIDVSEDTDRLRAENVAMREIVQAVADSSVYFEPIPIAGIGSMPRETAEWRAQWISKARALLAEEGDA